MKSHPLSIYILLAFICLPFAVTSQQLSLESTPRGAFIVVKNSPVDLSGWRIERARARGLAAQNWPLRAPVNEQEYRQSLLRFNQLFPEGAVLETPYVDSLWQLRRSSRTITHPAYLLAEGQAILDTAIQKDQRYTYQLINPAGKTVNQQTISYPQMARLPQLKLVSSNNGKSPMLRWQAANVGDLWSAKVFRQDPVSGRFQRIATEVRAFRSPDSDSVTLVVLDTTLTEQGYWRYYIQATDRYGNVGPVADVGHILWLDDKTRPAIPQLTASAMPDQPTIALKWELTHPERLNAIRLFRSQAYGGPYELLAVLPPETRTYTDRINQSGEAYFYYLEAIDLASKPLRSAIVAEAFQGERMVNPPLGVQINIENDSIVITWSGDAKQDYGYIVYRANGHRGELIPVSSFIRAHERNNRYTDNSLSIQAGEFYSYAVKAISGSNTQSDFSERVSVQAPGVSSIPSPDGFRSRMKDGNILLTWETLGTRAPTVTGYHIYRRMAATDTFRRITLNPLDLSANRFLDTNALGSFEYGLRAVDINGREGLMSRLTPPKLEQILDLRPEHLQAARTNSGIQLAWPPISYPDYCKTIQIFRSAGENPFILIEEVSPSDTRYSDHSASAEERYRYYLMVKDQQDRVGPPTKMVSLRPKLN